MTADCFITGITVQIPFELSLLRNGDFSATASTELVVSENGNVSKAFKVVPITDTLHVMNTCDVFPSPKVIRVSQPVTSSGPSCATLITHANGDLITADDPARPNEEIVIWAFGLGATTPAVKTGTVTPTPAPVLSGGEWFNRTLELQFDFRPNAGPSNPTLILTGVISSTPIAAPVVSLTPVFVGLTPGQVGLYQINVQLPSAFPAVVPCTTLTAGTDNTPAVQSNLTIDIGGTSSFDGAAICVQPPQ